MKLNQHLKDWKQITCFKSNPIDCTLLARWDAVQQYGKRYPLEHNCSTDFVFSMASYKRRARREASPLGLNYHLLERFIDKLDLDPTLIKSHPNYSNLYDYGAIAA